MFPSRDRCRRYSSASLYIDSPRSQLRSASDPDPKSFNESRLTPPPSSTTTASISSSSSQAQGKLSVKDADHISATAPVDSFAGTSSASYDVDGAKAFQQVPIVKQETIDDYQVFNPSPKRVINTAHNNHLPPSTTSGSLLTSVAAPKNSNISFRTKAQSKSQISFSQHPLSFKRVGDPSFNNNVLVTVEQLCPPKTPSQAYGPISFRSSSLFSNSASSSNPTPITPQSGPYSAALPNSRIAKAASVASDENQIIEMLEENASLLHNVNTTKAVNAAVSVYVQSMASSKFPLWSFCSLDLYCNILINQRYKGIQSHMSILLRRSGLDAQQAESIKANYKKAVRNGTIPPVEQADGLVTYDIMQGLPYLSNLHRMSAILNHMSGVRRSESRKFVSTRHLDQSDGDAICVQCDDSDKSVCIDFRSAKLKTVSGSRVIRIPCTCSRFRFLCLYHSHRSFIDNLQKEQCDQNSIIKAYKNIFKQRKISCHSFRVGCCLQLLLSSVSWNSIASWLRWSNTDMVSSYGRLLHRVGMDRRLCFSWVEANKSKTVQTFSDPRNSNDYNDLARYFGAKQASSSYQHIIKDSGDLTLEDAESSSENVGIDGEKALQNQILTGLGSGNAFGISSSSSSSDDLPLVNASYGNASNSHGQTNEEESFSYSVAVEPCIVPNIKAIKPSSSSSVLADSDAVSRVVAKPKAKVRQPKAAFIPIRTYRFRHQYGKSAPFGSEPVYDDQ